MNTFTKRSLATAAVAGLVVLGGAPAASAADSQREDRQESVLGGPIELGGLQLGSAQDSSSGSSTSSTESDDDDRETRSSSDQDSSSRDFGFGVGDLRIDPRTSFLQEGASTSEDDGEERTSRRSTDLAGSLGIEFGGVNGSFRDQALSSLGTTSEDQDEDGTETDRSSVEDQRVVGGAFDTGAVELRPGGSLSTDAATDSEDDGDDVARELRSVLDLGAPFRYEGGTYVIDFFSSETREDETVDSDEDGTETDGSSSSEERSETFGGQLEGGQGDPGLSLDSEDLQLQDD